MAMNSFVGWSITALLSWLIGGNSHTDSSSSDPDKLNVNDTQIGTPTPVMMGRMLLRNPLISYYGDFRSEVYTESYAAHAQFSAWPIILTALAEWATKPKTGQSVDATTNNHDKDKHRHDNMYVTGEASFHQDGKSGEHGHDVKETEGPNYLMLLVQWLLMWLINGRNLKTTLQKGFKYYLGYQQIICASGLDIRLRGVYLSQDNDWHKVWEGNVSREDYQTTPFVVHVDNDQLFGGPDESGGFIGDLRVYLGGRQQPADSWMQQQMTADTIPEELRGLTPAYRPFVSIVVPTAYVGKQATIPQTWIDMQWIPNRLGLGAIGEDVNPAEAIYEICVNEDWGLKRDPALIDADSLISVGAKLKNEGLGITVTISSRTAVKTLIDDICKHVDMIRYTDPQTGKLTFKLIRDDYDVNSLPVFDENICESIEYTRTVWSNTTGEINSSYTDSKYLYQTSNLSDNDPANIEMNDGDMNSDDCDFKYFTTAENAYWATKRELKEKGFPLAAVTLVCNHKAAAFRNGDVVKLNWPPYGIKDLIIRVTSVDFGNFIEGKITIEGLEDVFGLGKSTFGFSDSTGWTQPVNYPTGVQLFRYFEAPWELRQSPDTFVFALAVVPDAKTQKWTVWRKRDGKWETTNSLIKWTPAGQLVSDYLEGGAVEDTVGFEMEDLGGVSSLAERSDQVGTQGFAAARNGSHLLMVNGEIMGWGDLIQLPNGHWRVQSVLRGTCDTVPASHKQGDTIYFLESGYYANVTTGGAVCPAGMGASESYNITTATADKEEDFSEVKVTAVNTMRRAERPNPPGRIRMSSHMNSDVSHLTQAAGDLSMTWAFRNKRFSFGCVGQDDTGDYWSGQSIKPQDGLQTVVRVYAGTERIHQESLDNTITKFDYSWGQRCLDKLDFTAETSIEVCSLLNGLESYQIQRRTFTWKPPYLLDGCESEDEAKQIILDSYRDGTVVVTFSNEADNRQIAISDMPLIVLGTAYDTVQSGAILCQQGKWIVPNGTVLAVTGIDTYEVISLTNGFVLLSYITANGVGLNAYQFSGTGFTQIGVPQ